MKKFKFSLRSWLTLSLLLIIGLLGNVYHLPLFFGVDFLFGSIAVLVILQRYGIGWGLFSALLISSYTYVIWHHPYGALVLFLEALWIGWFVERNYPPNLVWHDALYWGLLGIPLTALSLSFILHVDSRIVWLIAFKLTINGIFNALWASLIIAYTPIGKERLTDIGLNTVPFRQTIYNVLAASVLSIALGVMIFNTHLAVQEVQDNAARRLEEENNAIKETIREWVRKDVYSITLFAKHALQSLSPAELQRNLDILHNVTEDFLWIYMADHNATITAASNPSWIGKNVADCPYFDVLKTTKKLIISDIFRGGIQTDEPVLTIGVPILRDQQFLGYVQGALDLKVLSHWLELRQQHIGLQTTVLDAHRKIIASTEPSHAGAQATHYYNKEQLVNVDSHATLWIPKQAEHQPTLIRWQQAFFTRQDTIDEELDWQLVVKMPLAHYQHNLYALYLKNLAVMLVIILLIVWLASKISQRMVNSLERLSIISANLTNYFSNPQDITWPHSAITEVNILIANFKKMAQHLQNQFDAVEERSFKLAEITIQLQEKILERQETEMSLKRAKESAEVANRAKSTFLANMSHELRTPLNGILGYTQILSLDKNLTTEQREGIDIIHRSGEHLLTLINDILDLSKIEAGKLELNPMDFHFQSFLKDIADLFRMRAQQKGIIFKFLEQGEDIPIAVHADEKRLRQVLLNLLSNAVKFTEHGHFSFIVRSERMIETNQRKICFMVEDSGQGIADDHLETIFLPFKQVGHSRKQVEGTGLGLPISRRLVELMGGRLQVESTLNLGSKFWFEIVLPEVSGFEPVSTVQPPPIVGFKWSSAMDIPFKVLVVDDLRENRTVLLNLLAPLGFEVHEAVNGEEALRKAYDFLPQLVIMDLKMPIMDGLECTRRLRQSAIFEKTVIITVTASAFEFHQQESLNAGSNAFLTKPVVAKHLFQLMEEHCALQWVYEKLVSVADISSAHSSALNQWTIPPTEVINPLLKFAQSGDVQNVIKEVAKLVDVNAQWQPFLNEVHKLAKGFKIKRLKEFLKTHAG